MSNTFTTLLVSIAALFSRQPDRRAIVAKPAKRPRLQNVEPIMIHQPFVPSVAASYQNTNGIELLDIAAESVRTWQPNDGGDVGQCPPLNRGISLSRALVRGRVFHPLCRNAFVECQTIGFYGYEQRQEWRTCALAAAYAGIFGPGEIERPSFSYTQACWLLGQVLGYDPAKRIIEGPTGRRLPVAEEMIALTDVDLWTRRGVAAWLGSMGL